MTFKQNCWEYLNCGREPNGTKSGELGICPAATETRLDGVHDGKNAGRACWVVAGTFCNDIVQGVFAHKFPACTKCDFYKKVQAENFHNFQISFSLLKKLRES